MAAYDIGIVGAGISGASLAFALAKRGVSTVVFERGTPGDTGAGLGTAVCRANYPAPFLAAVARDSLQMYANFADATDGGTARYERTGAMSLHAVADVAEQDQLAVRLNELGVKTEVLAAGELAGTLPSFVLDDVGAATWEPDGGFVSQADVVLGLLRQALRTGAHVRTQVAVERIVETPQHVTVHTSEGDSVDVGRLVVSAGPWSTPLLRQVGADVPITAERHVAASFSWGGATPIPFVFVDVIGGFYFKPRGETGFELGPGDEGERVDPDDFVDNVGEAEAVQLARPVIRRVPPLATAAALAGWASIYDMSPDWQPIIGRVSDLVYVDAGTNGHGFRIGPALGAHVADLVTDTCVEPGLALLSPERFTAGSAGPARPTPTRILS